VAFFGGRLLLRTLYFRRHIQNRQPVLDPIARLQLDELRLAAALPRPIRLTESQHLGSPVAFGLGRKAEICLPARALPSLPVEQMRAMLGHEVSHHLRRDPLRLQLLNFLQVALFFQPMLRIARREIHQATEEQCDAWGAQQLEDRWAMAHCLAEVAAWLLPRAQSYPVASMARKRSRLTLRVQRLMEHGDHIQSEAPMTTKHKIFGVLALVAAPLLGPAVSLVATELPGEASLPASEVTETKVTQAVSPSAATTPLLRVDALFGGNTSPALSAEDQLLFAELDQEINGLETELSSLIRSYGRLVQQDPYQQVFAKAIQRLAQIREMRLALARILATQ